MLPISRHLQVAFYAADKSIFGTACQTTLNVGILATCLNSLEHCLQEWKIASSAQKSTAVLSLKTAKSLRKSQRVQILKELIQRVDTALYLWVTSIHSWPGRKAYRRSERRQPRDWISEALALREFSRVSKIFLLCNQLVLLWWTKISLPGSPLLAPKSESCTY